MALTKKEFEEIREEIDTCKRPIFFFHDDPDGLASFLILYRHCKRGCGIIVKATPKIDDTFLKKVEEYMPDKIFVLDIAMLEQSFADKVNVPVVWIDHHQPLDVKGTKYFNPRIHDPLEYTPVSYLCYQVIKKDLWVAMVGCLGDWYLPDFSKEFSQKYPDLLPEIISADEAVFNSRIGRLVSVFSLMLKGKTKEVMQCIKILTRIEDPYEILEQKSSGGSFIFKRYLRFYEKYQQLLKQALRQKQEEKRFLFIYKQNQISFTQDLANEILYKNPNKFIIIGREKNEDIKLSLRSRKINLLPVIKEALEGLDGYGGGHECACGISIKKKDFKKLIDRLKRHVL